MQPNHKILLLLALFCQTVFVSFSSAQTQDIIIQPIKQGPEKLLIYLQSALVPNSDYASTTRAIQQASSFKLWIGIPNFPLNTPDPLQIQSAVSTMISEVQKAGFTNINPSADVILAAHSIAGAFAPPVVTALNLTALVLHASYLGQNASSISLFNYAKPVLTLAAELDGLTRSTRIALELQKYEQIENSYGTQYAAQNKPVVLIPGIDHSQFAANVSVSFLSYQDLVPTVDLEVAHQRIAAYTSAFLDIQWNSTNQSSSLQVIESGIQYSKTVLKPFLSLLTLELNSWPTKAQSILPNLTAQEQAELNITNTPYNNAVTFAVANPTLQLKINPTIQLEVFTMSYPIYQFNPLDISVYPISADEIQTKMKSQEAILQALQTKSAAGPEYQCQQMNQQAIEQALTVAANSTLQNYYSRGLQLVTAPDSVQVTGVNWLAAELEFIPSSSDPNQVVVVSPSFYTSVSVPFVGGMHFCTLLSPARALEWMMIDSQPRLPTLTKNKRQQSRLIA